MYNGHIFKKEIQPGPTSWFLIRTRKGNLMTTSGVVNYASHVVSSGAVDMTTRKCSLLNCNHMSFVTACAHPAHVVSVSDLHLGAHSAHLVYLKEVMLRFTRTSRKPRFVWTIHDTAFSKFLPLRSAPLYCLLLDRCTNSAPKSFKVSSTPIPIVAYAFQAILPPS